MTGKSGIFDLLIAVLPPLIGIGALVVTWWLRKKDRQTKWGQYSKEDVLKHPIFDRIQSWRSIKTSGLNTGSVKKDKLLKRYIEVLLSSFEEYLKRELQTLSEESQRSVVEIYVGATNHFEEQLPREFMPEQFLLKIDYSNKSKKALLAEEVCALQASDAPYYHKVYVVFDQIRMLLGLILNDIEETVKALNGELERALEEMEKQRSR